MNIAMWSGPRNLSTAMMYSFGARDDFDVVDEPFYGAFLNLTGEDHPMRDPVLGSMSVDADHVAEQLRQNRDKHVYQKHMAHHMVAGVPRDWFADVRHTFLIRHPARVIASYLRKRERPTLDDIGFVQQVEIYEDLCAQGVTPIVVDSFDIRKKPEAVLRALCHAVGIAWDAKMLSWPKGPKSFDGVWAAHWYGAVHASSGFAGPEGPLPVLEGWAKDLENAALPYFEHMSTLKIEAGTSSSF